MDLTAFYLLANTLALILEQEGCSLSMVSDSTLSDNGSWAAAGGRVARREKRCTCENLWDRECVYYCHIGIVWVHTPRQVVPYGVGSLPVRLRRDAGRCVCTNIRDSGCLQFCKASQAGGNYILQENGCFPLKEKYEWNLSEMERKLSFRTDNLRKS